jgi:hypothetical protein
MNADLTGFAVPLALSFDFAGMKDVKTASAQHLLRYYPTPEDIVALGETALAVLLRKTSRGKLREDRAGALFEAAGESVGLKDGRRSVLPGIELMLGHHTYERFIEGFETEMQMLGQILQPWRRRFANSHHCMNLFDNMVPYYLK